MTIDSAVKMWSRGGGEDSTDDGVTYKVTAEEVYQVVHSTDATDDEIRDACPALMSPHSSISSALVRKRSVQRKSPIFSYVSVSYSGGIGPGNLHPVYQAPEIEWTDANSTEAIDTDGQGLPFTNVNGEVLTGFSDDVADWVLTVKRNFFNINTYSIRRYKRAVNSDWFGRPGDLWPPGTAWLQQFRIVDKEVGTSNQYCEVTARVLFREPYNTIAARAWWARYRNEGFYVRSGVLVSFSGGGGSGAAGYAVVSGGVITKIVIINGGTGYTGVPTVSVTAPAGSGFAGTAVVAAAGAFAPGSVTSVTVTNGGSGYSTKLTRAVDGNKQPFNRPILLKADGSQEFDASAAVWIERPKKPYSLPYSVLGLI